MRTAPEILGRGSGEAAAAPSTAVRAPPHPSQQTCYIGSPALPFTGETLRSRNMTWSKSVQLRVLERTHVCLRAPTGRMQSLWGYRCMGG